MQKSFFKNFSVLIILIFFSGLNSCEEDYQGLVVDCSECYTTRPSEGELKIKLTINEKYPSVPIVIYRGDIEEKMIKMDTATTENYYINGWINKYYSVTAEYKSADKTIIAVDSDKLRRRKVTEVCDSTCWVIRGGIIDVRLKY